MQPARKMPNSGRYWVLFHNESSGRLDIKPKHDHTNHPDKDLSFDEAVKRMYEHAKKHPNKEFVVLHGGVTSVVKNAEARMKVKRPIDDDESLRNQLAQEIAKAAPNTLKDAYVTANTIRYTSDNGTYVITVNKVE